MTVRLLGRVALPGPFRLLGAVLLGACLASQTASPVLAPMIGGGELPPTLPGLTQSLAMAGCASRIDCGRPLLLDAATARAEDQPSAEAPDVWIAAATDTSLWDGPGGDAARIERLPAGSYFMVIGDAESDRLPVRYLGNATMGASDGWVDAAAIGPIPPPEADWVEPSFPPRRIVTDLRSEVQRGDPSLPLIALTFDAGADRGASLQLLDVLRDRGVHATFFITGQFADRYPDIMQRIAADGHELANHSYTHPDFAHLSEPQMRSEIRRATEAIEAMSGATMAPFWRAPFGSRDSRVLQVVEGEGLRPIYWTFDSGDWLDGATTDRVLSTDLRLAAPGAIVVHHIQPQATAEAMPTIVDTLRERGYELVTVSDLIGPQ